MKVIMVSKACLVSSYQTKLQEIAKHEDVELTVIVPPFWADPAGTIFLERGHTEGYTLLADPIRFNGNYHLHYYPKLGERLRTLQPDILHIDEEPYNLATWLAWRQAKKLGIKSLFFSWQNIARPYPIPFRWMEQQVLDGVDFALMGNHDSVEVWRSKGYKGQHAVIPQFGVDISAFVPQQKDAGRVFTIGSANRRLVPEKGVDLLLEAVAELPGLWRLQIAGDGPERPFLEQQARELGIAERVQFDGVIGSDQMPAYLRQLDVLVLASRTLPNWKEQFGRILVEAMASELPVIGAKSGEIPNVIGDAGLIFPEGNVESLRNHLLQLMQSPELRYTLGRNGRLRALAEFTQEQVAAQTVAVYRQLFQQ